MVPCFCGRRPSADRSAGALTTAPGRLILPTEPESSIPVPVGADLRVRPVLRVRPDMRFRVAHPSPNRPAPSPQLCAGSTCVSAQATRLILFRNRGWVNPERQHQKARNHETDLGGLKPARKPVMLSEFHPKNKQSRIRQGGSFQFTRTCKCAVAYRRTELPVVPDKYI